MELIIVAQATGQHGWSSFECYVNGARELGHSVRVLKPQAPWGASCLEDDDGLRMLLASSGSTPIVFCGFDWHSQPIHNDPEIRKTLNAWRGPRIGLFQEHLCAEWIQNDPSLRALFESAAKSACEVLTHVVCNHEQDVEYLRRLGVTLPVIFLPFCADLSVFRFERPFNARDGRAFFRGKRLEFMGSSPYANRERIASFLRGRPEALIEDLLAGDQLNRAQMINRYVYDLNSYAIQLNLPSVSTSLTCRPFEVMACGGLLLQQTPEGEISNQLLPRHLYADFDGTKPEQVFEAIKYFQSSAREAAAISMAGQQHVALFHNAMRRMSQVIDWVTATRSDSVIYNELSQEIPKAPTMWRTTDMAASAPASKKRAKPCVLVDLVFYQYARSGIAQVWDRLLGAWAEMGMSQHFVLAKREGSPYSPPDAILDKYRCVTLPRHGENGDTGHVQALCDEVGATLFVSTYYSMPTRTPALLLMHDCIPEQVNPDFPGDPEWAEKRAAIKYASGYLSISHATSNDLRRYYPDAVKGKPIYVSHNSFPSRFTPASPEDIKAFRRRHKLDGEYLLFAGERLGYMGYKNVAAICQALAEAARLRPQLPSQMHLLFLGGGDFGDELTIEPELDCHLAKWRVKRLSVSDEEISTAYSGASLSIYPSLCEGFGLPPGESLLCGTPVMAWPTPVNEEVYGDLLNYFSPDSPQELARQLLATLDALPAHKKQARDAGSELQARAAARGSSTQAGTFGECILLHAQLPLNVCDPHYEPVLFDACPPERKQWLDRLVFGHPDEVTGSHLGFGQEALRSAAIVSIYNGPDFIQGCLDDLLQQSEYQSGQMEILLIDSCSPGGEQALIHDAIRTKPRVRFIRTCERESLYRAWNRGARASCARYLSNANLDDRHRNDFFERLSEVFEAEPDVQLVYPAQYLSSIPNEHFADHRPERSWGWPAYSLEQLRIGNHVGSQPMWKRAVHQKIGWFDERYRIAGDYEFWCRIAHRVGPLKLFPVHIGLYYFNGSGIEHGNPLRSEREVAEICRLYGIEKNYTTSAADHERATDVNGNTAPRKLEDLQYNGIKLNGHVNVIVLARDGNKQALRVANSVLAQSIGVNHYIQVTLLNKSWSEAEVAELNSGLLGRQTPQIRAANDEHQMIGVQSGACSVLLFSQLHNHRCLESTMSDLYAKPDVKISHIVDGQGATQGIVGKSLVDVIACATEAA